MTLSQYQERIWLNHKSCPSKWDEEIDVERWWCNVSGLLSGWTITKRHENDSQLIWPFLTRLPIIITALSLAFLFFILCFAFLPNTTQQKQFIISLFPELWIPKGRDACLFSSLLHNRCLEKHLKKNNWYSTNIVTYPTCHEWWHTSVILQWKGWGRRIRSSKPSWWCGKTLSQKKLKNNKISHNE